MNQITFSFPCDLAKGELKRDLTVFQKFVQAASTRLLAKRILTLEPFIQAIMNEG